MPKNIVIFSDGTNQDGGAGVNSNVYRLFNMIDDRTTGQIAFYDRGVGTGFFSWLGGFFGLGISRNIKDCYRFIFDHYEAGDRIFMFGFSRGATTLRSLSNFMHLFGILPKSRPELIGKAYRIYRTRNVNRRKARAERFVSRHHTMWCTIEFMGVWDTVSALGGPFQILEELIDLIPVFRHKFQDLTLSECVIHARQALAIDEKRMAFRPIYWKKQTDRRQSMKQVWFPGVHTDIGGGYPDHGLSDLTLDWMVREATQKGLYIYPDHKVVVNPNPMGRLHKSYKGPYRLIRARARQWDTNAHGPLVIHRSAVERREKSACQGESAYTPWVLSEDYEVDSG